MGANIATMPTTQTQPEPVRRGGYLSVRELAKYLGVAEQTVYGWRKRGEGPKAVKIGRLVRYPWEEIERWEATRPAA